ncbi:MULTISPECIES: copper resistance protein NlpE [unclassified Myroides]|uniref:copper resistance protein NlpE n=1 Tax=unclassified Myroides TaxID=2642485 RepID=UPI0015FA5EFF|nr:MULTISPECIES: copper resistance protein NlpE [unclassified Myroides]MBB1151106.1 copper resistance protein NlpE N-terminal domain-containing protein [Myroides sp. NP-2]MDM1408960.1 copper resistance protein NlpE N-terminal domain-containing protein [Myroides sp. DF42-4-2]
MKRKYVLALAILGLSVSTLVSCKKTDKGTAETTDPTTKTEEVTKEGAEESLQDNSRTSLDWSGTYAGVLPCADCEGIETTLEIKEDGTYKQTSLYKGVGKGEKFTEEGKFEWDSTGSKLTLTPTKGEVSFVEVHEGSVLFLDKEGNTVTGPLAENYRLMKK